MKKINVLVVDNFELARYGLREILDGFPEINCLSTLSSGEQAVDYCRHHEVDIVVSDILLPKMDGVEAARLILSENPTIKVLALTGNHGLEYLRAMIRAGASGYLHKTVTKAQIREAINKVYAGGVYFCDAVLKDIIELMKSGYAFTPPAEINNLLTRQEKKVLKYVIRDFGNKEIAAELFISPRTVETHKRNLIRKLGLKDARELRQLGLKMAGDHENT